jgi:hypothetical protein
MVEPRWNRKVKSMYFSFPGAFKTYAHPWEEPSDSHPIINEWGKAMGSS